MGTTPASAKQYLTEVVIVSDSPLIGKLLKNTPLANQAKARVLEIFRGGLPLSVPLDQIVLAEGDRLRLSTALSSVMDLNDLAGVEISPKAKLGVVWPDHKRPPWPNVSSRPIPVCTGGAFARRTFASATACWSWRSTAGA